MDSLFAINFLLVAIFHNHLTHLAVYSSLASLLRGRKRFIASRVIMHSLHRSRLATFGPRLALARVPITQRYSAKKARYSRNRAAVYSGWPESLS